MKVGSLVVCIKLGSIKISGQIKWLPIPDSNTEYTVREITHENPPYQHEIAVRLEEGIIGYNHYNQELAMPIEFLKEVQPPEAVSIDALMEEVNEKELFAV